jgi:hypothetical protein
VAVVCNDDCWHRRKRERYVPLLNAVWDERTELLHEASRRAGEQRFITRDMKTPSTLDVNVAIHHAKRAPRGTAAY